MFYVYKVYDIGIHTPTHIFENYSNWQLKCEQRLLDDSIENLSLKCENIDIIVWFRLQIGEYFLKLSRLLNHAYQKHLVEIVNSMYVMLQYSSSVPEGKLMGVELIGVYKSGSINWG